MAKPIGAPDSIRGVATFLVLRQRRDGTPQRHPHPPAQGEARHERRRLRRGRVRRRRGVPALRRPRGLEAADGGGPSDGRSVSRLMAMTNVARLGVAMMGLGCARRALVESLCYAKSRRSWKKTLIDHPLMRRKLAEMIVDVEAVQAIVFDGYGHPNRQRQRQARRTRLRMAPALIKLKAARLGITMASDAIEVHGGNGYVETWPVARILRDAQINTLWEGPDNILCLDVRRAIEREQADVPFLERMREAVDERRRSRPGGARSCRRASTTSRRRSTPGRRSTATSPRRGSSRSRSSWPRSTPPRSSASRPSGSSASSATTARALVAALYAERYLKDRGPLRGIDATESLALEHFDELVAGALVDDRAR